MDPLETLRALVYQTPDEARRDQLWAILSDLSATAERDTLQIAVDYLKDHLARWPEALRSPPETFFEDPTLHVDDPRFDLLLERREAALMRFIEAKYPNPVRREQAIEEAFAETSPPRAHGLSVAPEPVLAVALPQSTVFAALERDLEALGSWRSALGHGDNLLLAEAATQWLKAVDARGERLTWDHGRIWREVSGDLQSPPRAAGLLVDLIGTCGLENRAWCDEMLDSVDIDEKTLLAQLRARLAAGEAPGSLHLLRWLVDKGRTAEEADLFIQGLAGSPDQRALCTSALSTCSAQTLTPAIEHLETGPDPVREAIAHLFRRVPSEVWGSPLRAALAVTRTQRTRDALQRALHWNRLAVLVRNAPPSDEGDPDIEAALSELLFDAPSLQSTIPLPPTLPTVHTLSGVSLSELTSHWLLCVLQNIDSARQELDPTLLALRRWLDDTDCAALFDALQTHSIASGHPERARPFVLSALAVLGDDAQLHGFGEALEQVPRPTSPWLEHGLMLFRRAPKPAAIAWCAAWKRFSTNIGLSQGAAALLHHHAALRDLSEADLIEQNLHTDPRHRKWLARHLEEAMIAGRLWTLTDFQTFFSHPLTAQLAQNLVFEAHSGAKSTFLTLPQALACDDPDTAFLIPHPMDLSPSALANARALQSGDTPFDQLDRGDPDDSSPASLISATIPGPCDRLHRRLIALGYDPILRAGLTTRARRRFGADVFISITHSGYNLGPTWLDGPPVKVLDALAHLDGQRATWSQLPARITFEVCRELRAIL